MSVRSELYIDFYKLSNSKHHYVFEFSDSLFSELNNSFIEHGNGKVTIALDKSESLVSMAMGIEGSVELTCDRSLDKFYYPVKVNKTIIFKYGEEEAELDDDIVVITRDTQRIDLTPYIYDYVVLEVPMKRLHPRFENDAVEDEIVYSDTKITTSNERESIDPRWEQLKKLNK